MGKNQGQDFFGGMHMKGWKKIAYIVAGIFLALSLLLIAAFILVFDVFSWQKLDHTRLTSLAQTTSIYDTNGDKIA